MTRLSIAEAMAKGYIPKKKKQPAIAKPTKAKWDAEVTPKGVRITIPGELPSLNVWCRWHWAKRKDKLDNLTRCMRLMKQAFKIPRYELPQVRVVYYFRTRRKRDMDNYTAALKPVLDAMRYAGIITEDNSEVLELLPVEFVVDKDAPRVEVRIKERD
jgi:Holliday junction resolvase RusA-like endonuclease